MFKSADKKVDKKSDKKVENEEEKEKRIAIAVKFLQNPELKNYPMPQVKQFLIKKGLNEEDIDTAIKRTKDEASGKNTVSAHIQLPQQQQSNQISQLSPDELKGLLEKSQTSNMLSLRSRSISVIDTSVFDATQLRILILSHNPLQLIPDQIGQLNQLTIFHAVGCRLQDHQISPSLYSIVTLQELNLSRNQLLYMDQSCSLQNLKILDYSHNEILTVPKEIANLTQLQILCLRNNNISTFPVEIKSLQQLNKIYIGDNNISDTQGILKHTSNPTTVFESIQFE